jgi:hypothetical protein
MSLAEKSIRRLLRPNDISETEQTFAYADLNVSCAGKSEIQSQTPQRRRGRNLVTAQHDELRNFLTAPLNDESTDVWLKIQSHRFFPFRILLAAPPTLKLRT